MSERLKPIWNARGRRGTWLLNVLECPFVFKYNFWGRTNTRHAIDMDKPFSQPVTFKLHSGIPIFLWPSANQKLVFDFFVAKLRLRIHSTRLQTVDWTIPPITAGREEEIHAISHDIIQPRLNSCASDDILHFQRDRPSYTVTLNLNVISDKLG